MQPNGGGEMGDLVVKNWFGDVSSRPAAVVEANSVADIVDVLKQRKKYPSPVRTVGSNHSTTACGTADGGTIVKMNMNRIVELDEDSVTVEAGARYVDVATELARLGRQLYINTEIGSLTAGSAACGGTKSASMPDEFGQVSSYVKRIKLVLPSGELLEVGDEDPQLLQMLRSSYGLCGIVYEVTLRTRPLLPLAVYFETFSLDSFSDSLTELTQRGESLMIYIFPYENRITAEFRRYNPGASGPPNRLLWRARNFGWSKAVPLLARGSTLIPRPLRYPLVAGFDAGVRFAVDHLLHSGNTLPSDQMIRFPEHGGPSRFTFSFFAFSEETYTTTLREYFDFCHDYSRQHRYRPNMLTVGYRVARDQNSLLSYSYGGPVMTIDPVSTGGAAWTRFLDAYNEFCTERSGKPLLNQTPRLTAAQLRLAYGERLDAFARARRAHDPDNRLLNAYFSGLLGEDQGPPVRRARAAREQAFR
jgi:FAD/FMN-containing dehydrogenase